MSERSACLYRDMGGHHVERSGCCRFHDLPKTRLCGAPQHDLYHSTLTVREPLHSHMSGSDSTTSSSGDYTPSESGSSTSLRSNSNASSSSSSSPCPSEPEIDRTPRKVRRAKDGLFGAIKCCTVIVTAGTSEEREGVSKVDRAWWEERGKMAITASAARWGTAIPWEDLGGYLKELGAVGGDVKVLRDEHIMACFGTSTRELAELRAHFRYLERIHGDEITASSVFEGVYPYLDQRGSKSYTGCHQAVVGNIGVGHVPYERAKDRKWLLIPSHLDLSSVQDIDYRVEDCPPEVLLRLVGCVLSTPHRLDFSHLPDLSSKLHEIDFAHILETLMHQVEHLTHLDISYSALTGTSIATSPTSKLMPFSLPYQLTFPSVGVDQCVIQPRPAILAPRNGQAATTSSQVQSDAVISFLSSTHRSRTPSIQSLLYQTCKRYHRRSDTSSIDTGSLGEGSPIPCSRLFRHQRRACASSRRNTGTGLYLRVVRRGAMARDGELGKEAGQGGLAGDRRDADC
jgi:hypothetical protein